FEHLKEGDVVLYDRYYPAIWLFLVLQSKGLDFVGRIDPKKWKTVDKLVQSGEMEGVLEFTVTKDYYPILAQFGIKERKIRCRISVAAQVEKGETLRLWSSFCDSAEFPSELLPELYRPRWGIDGCYKEVKCRRYLENFTGRSPRGFLQ